MSYRGIGRIGIIGGSGICNIPNLKITKTIHVTNKLGSPSGPVQVGTLFGREVAFIPRHGYEHTIPPHKVPYRANMYTLSLMGIKHVIATCVAGSLVRGIEPGTFVVPDQFINMTWGRDGNPNPEGGFIHLPMGQPYCSHLRSILVKDLEASKIAHAKTGTVVVIQGPRFSTIAESKMFATLGGDIVNMTQYPECYFAKEMGICYSVLASITDHDVGVPGLAMEPGSMERVLPIFRQNTRTTLEILERVVQNDDIFICNCAENIVTEYFRQSVNL